MVNVWGVPCTKMGIPVKRMNMQMEGKGRIVTFKIRTHTLVLNSNLLRSPHSTNLFSLIIFP
jgi:hypothetical protein